MSLVILHKSNILTLNGFGRIYDSTKILCIDTLCIDTYFYCLDGGWVCVLSRFFNHLDEEERHGCFILIDFLVSYDC